LTKSGDAGEDLVGGFGPNERFWFMICDVKVVIDGSFQLSGTAMDTAPQLFFSESGEEALDKVEPR